MHKFVWMVILRLWSFNILMISICKSKRKSNPSSVFTGLQNLGHTACAIHLKVVDIRSKREK